MYNYVAIFCAIAGVVLLTIVDTIWSLPVMVAGVVFSVVSIKKGKRVFGTILLVVNSIFLVINAIVFLLILAGELYMELFY